jgi:hypothetical protein
MTVSAQGGYQLFLSPLPAAVPEALKGWLRIGCVCCRNLHDSAQQTFVTTRSYDLMRQLITQRSLVQIQPTLPTKTKS